MDSGEILEETKLPPKNVFNTKLNMKIITDNDHEDAQQVWNTMEKKTLGCYRDICLKTEVLLLADVFESF